MSTDKKGDAIQLLLEGLTTDGAHHKQYYLEEACRALCDEEFFESMKKEFQWEDGIPS